MAMNDQAPESRPPRRRRRKRHIVSLIVWYFVPSLIGVGALGYVFGSYVLHVNPPVVPVEGLSMRPVLHTGDLVLLQHVDPSKLRKGDIIAVRVPPTDRSQYGLPANVVHRIVRIEHTSTGLEFITKGDANVGNDVFVTRPGNVIGELRFVVPDLGYPVLFAQSRQGEIFLGAAALVGLLYLMFGLLDERRAYVEGTMLTMQAVLEETERLELMVSEGAPTTPSIPNEPFGASAAGGVSKHGDGSIETFLVDDEGRRVGALSPPIPRRDSAQAPSSVVEARLPRQVVEALVENTERSAGMERTIGDLVSAVGEYAVHLRSHTSAVQDLARVAGHLDEVITGLAGRADEATPNAKGASAPAAWYDDPTGLDQLRWWDGQGWTELVTSKRTTGATTTSSDPEVPHGAAAAQSTGNSWDEERWAAYESWRDSR